MAIRTVQRFDRGELRRAEQRPDGSWRFEGIPMRAGILAYRQPDGTTRRELLPLSTIKAYADTIDRVAVTMRHPDDQDTGGLVTPENIDRYQVGDTDLAEVVEEGEHEGFVKVGVIVRAKRAIDAVKEGRLTELSPGYRARVDFTAGTHPVFGEYDAIQIERTGNHLALVERGRGDRVHLRADSAVQVAPEKSADSPPRQDSTMKNLVALAALLGLSRLDAADDDLIDRITAKVRADAEEKADAEKALTDAKAKLADAEKALTDMTTSRDEAQAKYDAAKASLDELMAKAKADEDAKAEAKVDSVAKALGVKLDGVDGLRAKRRAVLTARKIDTADDVADNILAAQIDVLASTVPDGRADGGDPLGSLRFRADSADRSADDRPAHFHPDLDQEG